VKSAVLLAVLAAAASARAGEVEIGEGHDLLSGGRPAWRATTLDLRLARPDRSALVVSGRDLARFGGHDRELAVAAALPWGGRWVATAEASASAGHRFTPAFAAAAGVERALPGGFALSGRVRWARYDGDAGASDPIFATAGVERYFGEQRLALTAHAAVLEGSVSGSGRVAWDLYYRDGSRVGVSFAAGRELESTGAPRPFATGVVAAAAAGRHAMGAAWAVAWEIGVQRQGALYTRAGARVGLVRRF
jgi:YaiO family outer membrane protein